MSFDDKPEWMKCPRCHCTNIKSVDRQFIVDDPLVGVHIVEYVCQWPECWAKIIDYENSDLWPLYRELGDDEDLGEPGLIKEIRFFLFLKRYWLGEIVRYPHSGKSSVHSFDLEAVDLDGNKYFFEVVSTYRDQGGYRLQTYNKNWRQRFYHARECRGDGDVYPFIIFELPRKGGQEWYGLPITARSRFLDYTSDLRLSKKLKRKISRLSKFQKVEGHESIVSIYRGKKCVIKS